jgi:hypothetical protein
MHKVEKRFTSWIALMDVNARMDDGQVLRGE